MREKSVQFFISHAGSDRARAEWVAQQLIDAGHTVELDTRWRAGQNFIGKMNDALERCEWILALYSRAYFDPSRYTRPEWTAALVPRSRLIPVRIENFPFEEIPPILQPIVVVDIFGMSDEQARQVLLDAVAPEREHLEATPPDAGQIASSPPVASHRPQVWKVPPRNPGYVGHGELLFKMREHFLRNPSVPLTLHGMPGMGKSELAKEYAHRFAASYDLAWWVPSGQTLLIGQEFTDLGRHLNIDALAGADMMRSAVRRQLQKIPRWLLVFDNVASAGDLAAWLPDGDGHVLITSRDFGFRDMAAQLEVSVFARDESIAMLRDRVDGLSEKAADKLASELGDLPLGIAQAAEFMSVSGMPSADYRDELRSHASQILDQSTPTNYSRSAAATVQISAEKLENDDPAALELASLCAFFESAPIPDDLLTSVPAELPMLLRARAVNRVEWRQTIVRIRRYSLAETDRSGRLRLQRVTQAILRDRLEPDKAAELRSCADALLVANNPGDPGDPATWAKWASLMPHLLVADPAASGNPALRSMASNACLYFLSRGSASDGHDLINRLYENWRERLGDDDPDTSAIVNCLMRVLGERARFADARELAENTLSQRRRVLGDEHRDTLTAASHLAVALSAMGEKQAARKLDEATLATRRRVLGDDDPETLASASNLAADLSELGKPWAWKAARALAADTWERRRRIQGDDHPDTLKTASNLATTMAQLRQLEHAKELAEDTLARRRRVLGKDHPASLTTALNLADMLADLGEIRAARELAANTLPRLRRSLGPDHPISLACADDLARFTRADAEAEAAAEPD